MPRRGRVIRRELSPDIKYNSQLVTRLINKLMQCGKKRKAEGIVYSALEFVEQQGKGNPVEVLEQAVKNATPLLQVKPRRVAGATYQVPVEVRRERGISLAMRWLVNSARGRGGKSMTEKLAAEILDAFQSQGGAVKKREELHRMAQANRAFVHFRW